MRLHPTAVTAALSLVLLAACATPAAPVPDPVPVPVPSPSPEPALPPANQDTCGAAAYASTLGQDYRSVPAAPSGRVFRVVCTTCAMTKDYSAERLNFIYDAPSGKVVRLTCG